MKFILIPLLMALVCQLLKLVIFAEKEKKLSLKKLVWVEFWTGKFPSSHSAMLASTFYLVATHSPDASMIGFAFIVSLLFIYSLLEAKKREAIMERYEAQSTDTALQKIVRDGALRDFEGHSLTEVVVGALIGLLGTLVLDTLL